MLISNCNKLLCKCTELTKYVFGEVQLCQKNERAEQLSGSIMPRAMDLLLVLKAKMFLSTTVPLLATGIVHFLKVRKWSLSLHEATKGGKRQKYPPRKFLKTTWRDDDGVLLSSSRLRAHFSMRLRACYSLWPRARFELNQAAVRP